MTSVLLSMFRPVSPRTRIAHPLAMAAVLLCAATYAPCLRAQSASTAPAYQDSGVSRPPSDDTIVANDDVVAAPSKPLPGTPSPAPVQQQPPVAAQPVSRSLAENPDYGPITSTSDAQPANADHGVHLISRPTDPDEGVVGMVPSPANQLAEGTNIRVRLLQALSTQQTQDGEPFRGQVANDVYKDGRVVIPLGSELRGRVTQVSQGHRLGAHATIRLRPDAVILPDGTAYHLMAQAISTSQANTRTDQEGGIQPTMHVAKDLAEYGAGAGGGAIVGGVLGGPVGAGAGALVGAGIVTTHMLLQKPQSAHVEQGSEVVFSLTEPMELLPTRN
ncbi:hypothetical protein [Acidipila sp. EB88]|uniref:hypothetical protein n=1 Tax=Acidipila sp. EB88 TaxID=2305226 RepID=UPI000F5E7E58|nr:hypothetical protein [Acidipila sp. EB88]